MRLRIGDQFRHGFHRQGRIDHQQHRQVADQRHRREILQRIVTNGFIEMRIGDHRGQRRQHKRAAVGLRLGEASECDAAALPRPVLDDERLAQDRTDTLGD
jgi:hypothetical protein